MNPGNRSESLLWECKNNIFSAKWQGKKQRNDKSVAVVAVNFLKRE